LCDDIPHTTELKLWGGSHHRHDGAGGGEFAGADGDDGGLVHLRENALWEHDTTRRLDSSYSTLHKDAVEERLELGGLTQG